MREVILDTETTGIEVRQGHRIIEIGCVEMVDRRLTGRHFHVYINPQREVDEGAFAVHGISDEFLADQVLFAQVADDFMAFIRGARLVIHNAPFDIGFIDAELERLGRANTYGKVADHCSVVDTLLVAREKHPGQRNSLDALCKRYGVDNSQRDLHGALLDAEILADVYLIMTGGQTALVLGSSSGDHDASGGADIRRLNRQANMSLPVILANDDELAAHHQRLAAIEKSAGFVEWKRMADNPAE